jgi:hypothetical protein
MFYIVIFRKFNFEFDVDGFKFKFEFDVDGFPSADPPPTEDSSALVAA